MVALFTSCGSDDPDPIVPTPTPTVEGDGSFTVNNQTFDLDQGFLVDLISLGLNSDGSQDYDVFLTSEGVNINADSSAFEGMGELVFLDFNAPVGSELAAGTYNYVAGGDSARAAFTLVDGQFATNVDATTGTAEFLAIISGGSVNVSVANDIYTLEYNLTAISLIDTTTVQITGNFIGPLTSL